MPILIIFALVIAFLAILFALQNNSLVTLNFLIWQLQGSLALVLLGTLAIGFIIGLLVATPAIVKGGWRVSRTKRQAASLESQLSSKEQQMTTQGRTLQSLRQSYQGLLQALDLTNPATHLIDSRLLPQTLAALLHEMQLQQGSEQYQSLALLLLQTQRAQPTGSVSTTSMQDAQLWAAIAQVIQRNITVDSWLFSDSEGRFMCVLTGYDLGSVQDYASALETALTEQPLQLKDGTVAEVDPAVGGAIADRDHPTNSEQVLLDAARRALEQAQQKSRHRVKVSRVTD
ncbi:DUF1049 domain-containing protein [Romeria aff. gracilis LEGE 07310]|uniref:DUF1049 domain-containing protein n=1 Tax=Vasconcelosia minhoensis LEGE 07310 TaxID=915328 RepID=A0A8J7DME3_9CYAN|nr:LapA family protein [Romeria gracilis]MBE9076460.1 DUF1049 domain-containing protein [Romeria aff. gracilis LEGE 07310]